MHSHKNICKHKHKLNKKLIFFFHLCVFTKNLPVVRCKGEQLSTCIEADELVADEFKADSLMTGFE